ncbi:MAG: shikimate dehydrogenase [Burkholderiaceae bacterium]|jgi:shikimate dehydrogenase|nr:shikimate dehydrogenase [Burkholderiaceae bacterium]
MVESDRYAVVGNPVKHSKSPDIHALFARQTGQNIRYSHLLAPLDRFDITVRNFMEEGGKGLNVTVPFKRDAYLLSDVLTPRAKIAGAVNTLFRDSRKGIVGDNTDGKGLLTDLVRNEGLSLAGKSVLLLGAGGAARGVIQPLLEQNPACLCIANRNLERARELAALFSDAAIQVSPYGDLKDAFDIVINATSAGLVQERPPVPAVVFNARVFALDMVYGAPTPFMAFARQHGAQVRDGLGMLVEQAAESFLVWRGVLPDTAPVLAALRTGTI